MKAFWTVLLLVLSNTFMTLAWYGHLKFFDHTKSRTGLFLIILISWGIAFFEYIFQVPANRLGFKGTGGPFDLVQLKVIQETVSISVFIIFTLLVFKNQAVTKNYLIAFLFILLAVYFTFRNA
jgi:uncharacterized protein (DUF486 family)